MTPNHNGLYPLWCVCICICICICSCICVCICLLIAVDQGSLQKQRRGVYSVCIMGFSLFAPAGGMEGSELDPPPAKKGKGGRKKKVRRGTVKSPEFDPKLPKNQRQRNRLHTNYSSRRDGEEGESSEDIDPGLQLSTA